MKMLQVDDIVLQIQNFLLIVPVMPVSLMHQPKKYFFLSTPHLKLELGMLITMLLIALIFAFSN